MIATKPDIETQSNVGGRKIDMSLESTALVHLMAQYIDMYTDTEIACVREYSTNARDSHIAAGNDAPIEVHTPTSLNAVLRIVDHGLGMDEDDIDTMYSRYGASTKRESNDYNGVKGLGCKSGLAYSNQFTLICRKDGVETIVLVARDEDGAGSMTCVSTTLTNEPNGVEVQIPAKAQNHFAWKARDFFSYWPKDSVILDGRLTGGEFEHQLKVTDDIYVVKANRYAQDSNSRVVMGGVSYPVKREYLSHGLGDEQGLLAFVPIGTVDFPAAREGLFYNRKTKDALAAIAEQFRTARNNAIQAEISKSATTADAIQSLLRLRKVFSLKNTTELTFRYNGKDFPHTLALPTESNVVITSSRKEYGSNYNSHERIHTLDVSYLPNTVFIKGWAQQTFTATTKKKLMQWLEDKREEYKVSGTTFMNVNHFTLVNGDMPDSTWITPERIVEWEVIKAIKLPTPGRPVRIGADGKVTVSAGEYEVTTVIDGERDRSMMLAEEFDTTVPLFYSVYDKATKNGPTLDALATRHDEFYFVDVWANRLTKFERIFPHAKEAVTTCREVAQEWKDNLSQDDLFALWLEGQYNLRITLRGFDASRIDDPAVIEAIKKVKGPLANTTRIKDIARRYSQWVQTHSLTQGLHFKNPLDRYPLLGAYTDYGRQHEIVYMNTIYALDMAAKAERKLHAAILEAQV